MKKLLVVATAIGALTLPAASSVASESSAHVALTSDYVFRGLSYSSDGVAVQGGYDIQQSKEDKGWFAGVFASTVGDLGKKGLEVDGFGGWKGSFNPTLGYEVGGVFYKYTDSNFSNDATEIYAGVNYETAYMKIFSGSQSNGGGSYNYIDLGATFIVMKDIDLNVHYGRYSSNSVTDYNDFSASMNMDVKGFDLGLGLTYEDLNTTNNLKSIATVTKEFEL